MAEVATTLRPPRLNVINTRHAARRRADARTRRSRPQTRAPVVAPSGGVPSRSLPPPARAVIYRSAAGRPAGGLSRSSISDGCDREASRSKPTRPGPARPRRGPGEPGSDRGAAGGRYRTPADADDRCRLIATRDRWSAADVRDVCMTDRGRGSAVLGDHHQLSIVRRRAD